jgi:exodeoxyribonuclease V alpha subunit
MLGFKPGEGFRFDEDHPLPFDLLILDETSMLDVLLANQILRAIAPGAHLVLVGDVDQLPSVGPGDVLREIIDSALFPVTFLQTIFRQAEKSLIVRNAHRINQGEFPLTPKDGEDFFLFIKSEPAEAAALLVDIVAHRIPSKFNLDPLKEIQVLAPMHRGALGVEALNSALQQSLNPGANQRAELRMGGRVFRVGDKVMQTRNNYQKEVFNGDIGWVKEVNNSNQEMVVFFDDQRAVSYEFSALDELVHAFAVSVHKSQGSEFPCVVLPVAMAHYVMLQRNLLYTAVTRGRKLVVLVGTKRAIALAVRNDQRSERYSALKRRLLQLLGGEIKAR